MASSTSTGLSRVTIVAPHTRVDLALPADVPLADLLPTLLRYAGDRLGDDPSAIQGWALSRLGGITLDASRTPAQLDVRDGELLYLRPRGTDNPELVFDDVVDAVATATQDRAGRWQPATTRSFGVGLGLIALLAGVLAVLFAGPPQLPSGLVGLGVAAALLVGAVVLSRALADSMTAVAFALTAVAYGAAGGLLLFGGDRALTDLASPHVLTAATVALLIVAIASVGVADTAPVFLGAAICAVALAVGSLIALLTDSGGAGAAAAIAAIALSALPSIPMIAYRMGRLPIPSVPSGPEELKADTESVDGAAVLAASQRADGFLTGILSAIAVICAFSAIVVSTVSYVGVATAAVLGIVLLARARSFRSRSQRVPLLVAGSVALAAAALGGYQPSAPLIRLSLVLGALLLLGLFSIGYGLTRAGRKTSPVWGRTLDICEVLLILAVIPLAVWVSGLFDWIRAVRG
ncbi:type VII secretion integral membrane protein EccD [Actinoplanes sp. NPDC051851]|uniref:type VII secretion integral membrane protein EccD n=1 Tax=Actinoplanes sp. NPDC051851 TaxID=3154753 RepID=UPI003446ADAB